MSDFDSDTDHTQSMTDDDLRAEDTPRCDEWVATTLLFAVTGFYIVTGIAILLRAVTADQMWTLVLAFFVAGFVYFSSGIEAGGAISVLHSAVFGLLSFSVFFAAETVFFPPVPFPARTRLVLALFSLMTVGLLLWFLFGTIHRKGFLRGAVRAFNGAKRAVDTVRDHLPF